MRENQDFVFKTGNAQDSRLCIAENFDAQGIYIIMSETCSKTQLNNSRLSTPIATINWAKTKDKQFFSLFWQKNNYYCFFFPLFFLLHEIPTVLVTTSLYHYLQNLQIKKVDIHKKDCIKVGL